MTINYSPLEQLLTMDFTQMRGLKIKESCIATNDAISTFVTCLYNFFSQFQSNVSITREQRDHYKELMRRITDRINSAESIFFIKKHQDEGFSQKDIDVIVPAYALKSYADLPKRMQYWAAPFGDTVRNVQMHSFVVRRMAEWSRDRAAYRGARPLFSNQEDSADDLEDTTAVPRRLSF